MHNQQTLTTAGKFFFLIINNEYVLLLLFIISALIWEINWRHCATWEILQVQFLQQTNVNAHTSFIFIFWFRSISCFKTKDKLKQKGNLVKYRILFFLSDGILIILLSALHYLQIINERLFHLTWLSPLYGIYVAGRTVFQK